MKKKFSLFVDKKKNLIYRNKANSYKPTYFIKKTSIETLEKKNIYYIFKETKNESKKNSIFFYIIYFSEENNKI